MHKDYGIVRVSSAVPRVRVADPVGNTNEILALTESLPDSDVVESTVDRGLATET